MNHFDHQEDRHAVIALAQVLSSRLGISDVTAMLASQPLHEMLGTFEVVFGGMARSLLLM